MPCWRFLSGVNGPGWLFLPLMMQFDQLIRCRITLRDAVNNYVVILVLYSAKAGGNQGVNYTF
ncbi:hypothetical protein C942_04318 [Photobacterium marinum]|uniref:Uncharacterized protein n=1 Tax=Photobacterium marinum TaxID=1056511 RepID=L8JCQ2_9GAMM|nr:hypothetical protein C942_04318 [Photobacterium marinum]